jgi:AraC-like DNA-binding protein
MPFICLPEELIKDCNGGIFVAPGTWIHQNRTLSCFTLLVGKVGNVYIREGDEEHELSTGRFLLLRPEEPHAGTRSSPEGTSYYWIHFTPVRWQMTWEDPMVMNGICLPQCGQLLWPERVEVLLQEFLHVQEAKRYPLVMLKALVMCVLSEIMVQTSRELHKSSELWEARVRRYVEEHYTKDISTCKIARDLGVNPDYLGRVFRRTTGMTIVQYLTAYRIERAKRLLIDTSLNVCEVARCVGVEDVSYFQRLFKNKVKATPSAYRQAFCKTHYNIR